MNIENLRAFVTVAETLNFRKAAEKLFISQPALSRQIAELERELGVPLLERTTRSVCLTAAGDSCLNGAERIVRTWEAMQICARQASTLERETLHIGTYGRSIDYLRPVIEQFQKNYPEVQVSVMRDEIEQMYQELLGGELDLFCATLPRLISDENVERIVLSEEYPSVLLPQAHPLARRESISPLELKNEHFIMHSRKKSSSMYGALFQIFEQVGFKPNIAAVEDNDEIGVMKIVMGEGIGLYPSLWKNIPPGVVMVPLECDNTPFTRVAAWRKGSRSNARERFVSMLRKEVEKRD